MNTQSNNHAGMCIDAGIAVHTNHSLCATAALFQANVPEQVFSSTCISV